MKTLKLLFLIQFILTGKIYSQLKWTRTYQDTANITNIFQYNESYVGFGTKGTRLNYIRTNKNGDTLIKRVILDTAYSGYFYASSGAKTLDNKLIIAGIQNMNSSNEALRLYKLDTLGNIIWNYSYPNTSPNGPMFKMVPTADSGFAVFGHDALQGYLIKIDKNGSQVFRKNYGYSYMYPRDAFLNSDGSFIICGYQGLSSFTNFLFKTDPLGNILWTKSISATQLFESITKINSWYYVIGSRSNAPVALFKFDLLGNTLNQYNTGQKGYMSSLKTDLSKNMICTGNMTNADTVGLLKLDTLGNVLFKTTEICLNSGETYTCFADNDSNYVYAGRLDNRSFISKVYRQYITTGIAANQSSDRFIIYPDPVNEFLHIKSTHTNMTIEVMDCNGKIYTSGVIDSKDIDINLSELSPGMYFIKLSNSDQCFIKKIIKI